MNLNDPALDRLATARALLLEPYDLDEAKLQRALATIFEHKADYADLYFQYTRSESFSLEEGIVKSGSFDIEQGVGVRAVAGERTAFSYSDDISEAALLEAARSVRSIASAGGGTTRVSGKLRTGPAKALYPAVDPVATLEAAEKIKLLERIERMARARDARVKQVMANIGAEYDVMLVARSDRRSRGGFDEQIAADVRPLVRLSLTVIVEQDGRREQGFSGGGGRLPLSYYTDEVLQQYAKDAVDMAMANLVARPAPAGVMTVVLGPGWPGILLHEAVGHGLEGDFNRKGSSAFSGRIGQRVASKGVTVVDDGTLPDRRGSLNVDDEGNPTSRTVLIEDGVLRGYIQDSLNARLMNVPVTGNGRRESFAALPMPRMTNTYMLGGAHEHEEIIRSVKNGIYANAFAGGQVDITNGKFVFSMAEAYLIEDGKIGAPVKGATLIGNGPDALTRVTMIGNNMQLDSGIGTCGKDGQSVPVGVGQPTLRIEGLTVGGTGG
jgi:TldD protein